MIVKLACFKPLFLLASMETVDLDTVVHMAPIICEIIEPDSTESIEPIDIDTNDHMDPSYWEFVRLLSRRI